MTCVSFRVFHRVACAFASGILALSLAGCSLVDATLPPRAFDINQNTQNVRESGILLNIVRASRSEPLNFVALSKYTGTGSLALNDSLVKNSFLRFGAANSIVTGQSLANSVNANAANSFDVGTLENRDFYGGFLAPLDLEGLNLLLNAGLSREIVFHSVMQGFRVTRSDGRAFFFRNAPNDDTWTEGTLVENQSPRCAQLYDGSEQRFERVFVTEIWQPPHEQDCKYQKFLYFLRLAVRAGITVEAIPLPQPKLTNDRTSRTSAERDRSSQPRTAIYVVCYDAAIAQENNVNLPADAPGACGSKKRTPTLTHEFQFRFQFPPPVASLVPVVRSPYAVFQFYGHLLNSDAGARVKLSDLTRRWSGSREAALLTVRKGGLDCFARASYAGTDYCVPNEGARNTKEIFVLLNTLVAMSTNRSALPVSPTFVLTP
ncbi:MAG: hypothetical protein ACM31O_06020 [Bacteroidota bacterium]